MLFTSELLRNDVMMVKIYWCLSYLPPHIIFYVGSFTASENQPPNFRGWFFAVCALYSLVFKIFLSFLVCVVALVRRFLLLVFSEFFP